MKIGIISDTHDDRSNVRRAVELFAEHNVEYVLHSGDLVSPFIAKMFADVQPARFIAVFGNNEGEKLGIKAALDEFGGEIHDVCYEGEIGGKRVFMTHVPDCIEAVSASQMFDLVIYGHTHKADIRRVGKTLVINPGAAIGWFNDEPRAVVLNLNTMEHWVLKLT